VAFDIRDVTLTRTGCPCHWQRAASVSNSSECRRVYGLIRHRLVSMRRRQASREVWPAWRSIEKPLQPRYNGIYGDHRAAYSETANRTKRSTLLQHTNYRSTVESEITVEVPGIVRAYRVRTSASMNSTPSVISRRRSAEPRAPGVLHASTAEVE